MKRIVLVLMSPAESHYTADYPEEELSYDDEYNRNPYRYTNRSDEEWDEEWSGEDANNPWGIGAKKPAWFRKMRGEISDESTGEDDDDRDAGDDGNGMSGLVGRKGMGDMGSTVEVVGVVGEERMDIG
jgi:hypothetical protein